MPIADPVAKRRDRGCRGLVERAEVAHHTLHRPAALLPELGHVDQNRGDTAGADLVEQSLAGPPGKSQELLAVDPQAERVRGVDRRVVLVERYEPVSQPLAQTRRRPGRERVEISE